MVPNADRHDTSPKVKSAVRDNVEQMRQKQEQFGLSEMAQLAGDGCEGDLGDVHAVGRQGESKEQKQN